MDEHNPLKSVEQAIAFSSRDWSQHHRDAWIYGILFGWGDLTEHIASKHKRKPETVARLHGLHKEWVAHRNLIPSTAQSNPSGKL